MSSPCAEFEQIETAYRVAQEEFESASELAEKGLIGREEDIQAREAEVRGLEGRVVEANLQLQDCTLRAPYDGVIAQRFVEQGQNVRAKEPIVRLQDVDEIDVVVDVPEAVMAADIRTADIVQLIAELSGAPEYSSRSRFARSPRSPIQRRKHSRFAPRCGRRTAFECCPA